MKNFFLLLLSVASLIIAGGCVSSPEYYTELTEAEQKQLLYSARALALQGNAVPERMKMVFKELEPFQRIIYNGNKRGKATFRWEIYDIPENVRKLTQKDVNPYWVMVYAIGDLTDPKWQLTHANEDPSLPTINAQPNNRRQQNSLQNENSSAFFSRDPNVVNPNRSRQRQKKIYRR